MNRLLLLVTLIYGTSSAQPYLDIANTKYQLSPASGSSKNNGKNSFQYFNAGINLPLIFKKDSSMIVFSPFVERWDIDIENYQNVPTVQSMAFPVTFIHPLSSKWRISLTVIPRWNGWIAESGGDKINNWESSFQMGGAVLATRKVSKTFEYKFGVYYNSEFSGPFVMPLIGLDWKIDEKNNLFGVLPGNLVFEHKTGRRLRFGGLFRSITNSYKAGYINLSAVVKYIRIEENQLCLYGDYYLTKKIVLGVEAGHSVFRKYRFGVEGVNPRYFRDERANDNMLFKASLAYRLRFR